MAKQMSVASRTSQDLPGEIEVYELGSQRLYVKTGRRNFAISEADVTPEELVSIARDMAARQRALAMNPQLLEFRNDSFGL
jgi:hypothetical protein